VDRENFNTQNIKRKHTADLGVQLMALLRNKGYKNKWNVAWLEILFKTSIRHRIKWGVNADMTANKIRNWHETEEMAIFKCIITLLGLSIN
jgi:hypothetical protein